MFVQYLLCNQLNLFVLVISSEDETRQGKIIVSGFFPRLFSTFLDFVSYHNGLIGKINHIHLAVMYTICVNNVLVY